MPRGLGKESVSLFLLLSRNSSTNKAEHLSLSLPLSLCVCARADYIGFLTMVAGGLVAFEELFSYMWWRRKDCDATRPW